MEGAMRADAGRVEEVRYDEGRVLRVLDDRFRDAERKWPGVASSGVGGATLDGADVKNDCTGS
jgi:hypothetical protein